MVNWYRKKPVAVQAFQWNGTNITEVADLMGDSPYRCILEKENLIVSTLEGEMTAKPGWWVIRGVKDELYPCDPEVFEVTYEEVT